jgi:predicted nucleic acid-binding protein
MCAVNVAEFYAGLPLEHRQMWDQFFASLTYWYWEISRDAAARAGADRYQPGHSRKSVTTTDGLVAAVARDHGATIITNNIKDYAMEEITLLSLR